MFSGHFVKMFVLNIPQMFRESVLQCSVGFSNVLCWALFAAQHINKVPRLTVYTSVDVNNVFTLCRFHSFSRFDKWSDWTVITLFNSSKVSFGPQWGLFWNFSSYKFVFYIWWPFIGHQGGEGEHFS